MTNSNSQLSTQNSQLPKWRGVFFDGPQSDQDREGDEIPSWVVYIGDEDAEPIGKVYTFHNYRWASDCAQAMAHDHRIELIDEAMPA